MRTFAVVNEKGGCGKTTIAINLASALAEKGHRTLLVDIAPQGHCAVGVSIPESTLAKPVADGLRSNNPPGITRRELTLPVSVGLDLLPSMVTRTCVERQAMTPSNQDTRLSGLLERLSNDYDMCVIDCPPFAGMHTRNAVRAADDLVIPVEAGYFALHSIEGFIDGVRDMNQRSGHRAELHVLMSMVDPACKIGREVVSLIRRRLGNIVMPLLIHYDPRLKESVGFGKPVREYDELCRASQEFERLAGQLLSHEPNYVGRSAPAQQEQRTEREPVVRSAAAVAAAGPSRVNNRAAELAQRVRALTKRTDELEQEIDQDMQSINLPEPEPKHVPAPSLPPAPQRHEEPPVQSPTVAASATTPIPGGRLNTRNETPSGGYGASDGLGSGLAGGSGGSGGGGTATAVATHDAIRATMERTRIRSNPRLPDLRYGVQITPTETIFKQPRGTATRIAIVGDFNNWSTEATVMEFREDADQWEARLSLRPGRYHYRLVVDGRETIDTHNRRKETDAAGRERNIIDVI